MKSILAEASITYRMAKTYRIPLSERIGALEEYVVAVQNGAEP